MSYILGAGATGPSGPTPMDRQTTAFEELIMQLDKLDAEFGQNSKRLYELANRALGPEPPSATPQPTNAAKIEGQLSLFKEKIEALSRIADYQRSQLSRLERVL